MEWNSTGHYFEDEPKVSKIAGWCFAALFLVFMVNDILTVFIIKKTPTLQSYTGNLFISQIMSSFFLQFSSFLQIITYYFVKKDNSWGLVRYGLRLLLTGFKGIKAHTLTAICLNLYFAICHSTLYRNRMSNRYVKIFVPVCWVSNLSLSMCSLALKDPLFVSDGFVLLARYEDSALYVWTIIVTIVFVLPALITAFAFIKIWNHSRSIRAETPSNINFHDKFLLSKVMVGISSCYITLWSLGHLLRALQVKFEKDGAHQSVLIVEKLAWIPYFLNLVYDGFKVLLYITVYQPIRNTVQEMFRKVRTRPNDDVKEQHNHSLHDLENHSRI